MNEQLTKIDMQRNIYNLMLGGLTLEEALEIYTTFNKYTEESYQMAKAVDMFIDLRSTETVVEYIKATK